MLLFTFLVSFCMAFLVQKLIYKINIWFNFVFSSFFEQDHLLNLFNLAVLRKDHLNEHVFQNGVSFWKNGSSVYAELNETAEAATSSYSTTGQFLWYTYSVLVAKNYQNIWSKCLVDEFSFSDIFLNSIIIWLWLLITTMKRCAERCALKLYRKYLLKALCYLQNEKIWVVLLQN